MKFGKILPVLTLFCGKGNSPASRPKQGGVKGGSIVEQRGMRKTRLGKVVSDKMDKTVVVTVETLVRHPLYGKTMRRSKRLKAHDENNQCRIGDVVKIMETRPISRDKQWRVVEVVEATR
jgi:small subunit ribosomal protein S17